MSSKSNVDYVRTRIDRSQARSMVMSSYGIVASESPLASQAGASMLASGGHAVDAAIAANAMMGVVAPMMNGVGGDLFAQAYDNSTGRIHGVNASGCAPSGLSVDLLRNIGMTSMPQCGIHSVTVPGAVAGWSLLHSRFGRKSFAEILGPAIEIAERGFPVPEITALEWAGSISLLSADASAARTYLPDGRPPHAGEIFRNPDLAETYRQIAVGGRDAFYAGDIAQRLIGCSRQYDGTMKASDLAEFAAHWVDPLSTTYRGWTLHELPPNGQGIAALMMLNIIENFEVSKYGPDSTEALHVLIEAKKLAYADMIRHLGDPDYCKVPVGEMLSKSFACERARLINSNRASERVEEGKFPKSAGDTTYLAVVDREGNMVSLIQSNFGNFGSGLVPEKTGFALQSRGGLFTLEPNHPNTLLGGKRPIHTIIPGMLNRGNVWIAFGIMGGWNQSQAHAQFVSNVVDHGLNIQAALEAPRFTKITFAGCDVLIEDRVPEAVRLALARRGHEVETLGAFSSMVGGGQAVMRNEKGVNFGASDPRKDGAAIPEPLWK